MSRRLNFSSCDFLSKLLDNFLVSRNCTVDGFNSLPPEIQHITIRRLFNLLYYYFPSRQYDFRVRRLGKSIRYRGYLERFVDSIYVSTNNIDSSYIPPILFHGTTSRNRANIMENGIVPSYAGMVHSEDTQPMVWLTTNLCVAENFACCANEKPQENQMICVVRPISFRPKMERREGLYSSDTLRSAFWTYRRYCSDVVITPDNIVDYWMLPSDFRFGAVFFDVRNMRAEALNLI